MSGAIRKFPAVLLVLGGLCGCTYWTTDFERIVDQTGRDFKIDPDKNYKRVALSEIVAHPSSFKLVDVRFQAIMNRRDEQAFTAFYTTFRQEDYISFSLWPVEAQLWEQSDRLKSLPTFYIRKDNPHIQEMLDTRRYALDVGIVLSNVERGKGQSPHPGNARHTPVRAGRRPGPRDGRLRSDPVV